MRRRRWRRAVDRLERLEIGGSTQWALVRGRDRQAPVLLLVQAGPGIPMIHEARALENSLRLEDDFRVVYWDQRGTGKSFAPSDADERITVDRLAADLGAVLHTLSAQLAAPKIAVVGFSLGASIALIATAREPDLVRSLVCVGPDVDFLEAERFAYEFALREAERRGKRRVLRALDRIGAPPHRTPGQFMERVRRVADFGGIDHRRRFTGLALGNLLHLFASPHYSLAEVSKALRGMRSTQAAMLGNLASLDLLALAPRIAVPVTFCQGRRDAAAPPDLTARYFEALDAPRGKRIVWFEESAHMPHLEEPERFRAALLEATAWSGEAEEMLVSEAKR